MYKYAVARPKVDTGRYKTTQSNSSNTTGLQQDPVPAADAQKDNRVWYTSDMSLDYAPGLDAPDGQIDAWVSLYNQKQGLWGSKGLTRDAYKQKLTEARDKGKADLDKHTGWGKGLTWNPLSIGTLTAGGSALDTDWFNSVLRRDNTNGTPYLDSADPITKAQRNAYESAISGKSATPVINTMQRRATAGQYVAGRGLRGVTFFLPGAAEWYSKWLYGKNTYDIEDDYIQQAARDFGAEAAINADRWLRLYGMGAEVAASALTGGVLAKGLMGSWNLPAGTALPTKFLPRLGARLAQHKDIYVNAAKNAWKIPIWEGLGEEAMIDSSLYPEMGVAAQNALRVGGMIASLKGMSMRYAPVIPTVGTLLTTGGEALMTLPVASKVIQAGTYLAKSPFGRFVTAPGRMILNTGKYLSNTAIGKSVHAFGNRMFGKSELAALAGDKWGAIKYGMMSKLTPSATGIARGMHSLLIPSASWLYEGISDNLEDTLVGNDIMFYRYFGPLGRMMEKRFLLQGIDPEMKILNSVDAFGISNNAGKIDDILANFMTNNEELTKTPEGRVKLLQGLGLEAPDDISEGDARKLLADAFSVNRADIVAENTLYEMDRNFDWANASAEDAINHIRSLDPEVVNKAKARAYRADCMLGGPILSDAFTDRALTPEQRKDNLELWLRAEANRRDGFWKTKYNEAKALIAGPDSFVIPLMQSEDNVFIRAAVVDYAASRVQDVIEGKAEGGIDKDTAAIINEFTPDELRQMMTPLYYATPEQVMKLQDSNQLGSVSQKFLQHEAERIIIERLQHDGPFLKDFIPLYKEAVASGKNLTVSSPNAVSKVLEGIDVDSIAETMGKDDFIEFGRTMLSDKGQQALDSMDGEKRDALISRFESVYKEKMWEKVKEDPLKYLPIMTGTWMRANGWDAAAEWTEKPWVFYGTLALLLIGGAWLALSGDDDEDNTDNASLLSEMTRQRRLQTDDYETIL